MDLGTLFGIHTFTIDPGSLLALAWLYRLEKIIASLTVGAARIAVTLENMRDERHKTIDGQH